MHSWFAGLCTLDVVHHVEHVPERNTKVTARQQFFAAGGPATNAAVTASRIGVKSTLITAIGAEPQAEIVREDLKRYGVMPVDVSTKHDLSVSSVIVDRTGDRTVVSADAGAPELGPLNLSELPTPSAVLLDGHHPTIQTLVCERARELNAQVILDAGRWRTVFDSLIPNADVVACSADFSPPWMESSNPEQLALAIRGQGARAVVITNGARPVYWQDSDSHGYVKVPHVPVVDTLGAGDVFHGALTSKLAQGFDLPTAVESSIRVASTRVQWLGPRLFLKKLHV